jgi:hypothetical protein
MQSDILVSLVKFPKSPLLLFSLVKKIVFFFDISSVVRFLWQSVVTSVRTSDGDTNDFPINIGLHQGSVLTLIYLPW